MRRRASTSLLAGLLLASLPASSAASSGASFTPCAQDATFSCASVAVPLDRTGAVPGTIGLSVERRTAAGGPSPVAIVALAGGPGQATLPLARFIAEAVSPALAGGPPSGRDLLLFDQRGTGASGPLSCPALSGGEIATANSLGELIEHCARELGPARGDYTTRESVADIEAVRQAAGYEKLVLYGTSYGTKVALAYAQRYPQHVASLVLDSTETPEGPEPFHVSTFKAIRPMLAELCSRHACDRTTRTPLPDLARLVAEASAHPLRGVAYDQHGKPVRRSVTPKMLFDLLLDGDLNPVIRAELPAAVRAALDHDLGPLVRLLTLTTIHPAREEAGSAIDETLFIDTSCEETPFPWQRAAPQATRAVEAEAALNALPGSDFYPFGAESALLDMTIPLCVAWPDASAAPPPGGPLPDVPTLILSGRQDLRTPTANARQVAALIPDAQLVRVPYTGHSVIGSDLSGCARSALVAFFAGAAVNQCAATRNRFPPAPLAPTRLAALAPTPGVDAAQGRTVKAAVDTILDVRRTIIELTLNFGELPLGVRFGGLRGGTVAMTGAGAKLAHLSYVPGVQLTGLVPRGVLLGKGAATAPSANLRVGGSAAAAGRLRIAAGGRLSGVLGGRSFHVNVAAQVKVARAREAGDAGAWPEGPVAFPLPALARIR
jgi:pimeloyl-ACP methyl ester carboxylesterase